MDYKEKYESLLRDIDIAIAGQKEGEIKTVLQNLKERNTESEDERMRKQLLDWFKGCSWDTIDDGKLKREDIIAWLEKQGEKVNVIENFDTEFEKQVSRLIASTINKEHEYNDGFVKWAANALLNYAKHELEKQGEQKPAEWSEKDEQMINDIIEAIDTPYSDQELEMVTWLKSLKERHTWKPNEEQMEMEMDLKKEIDRYCEPIQAWQIQENPFTCLVNCARHFYELGRLNARKEK